MHLAVAIPLARAKNPLHYPNQISTYIHTVHSCGAPTSKKNYLVYFFIIGSKESKAYNITNYSALKFTICLVIIQQSFKELVLVAITILAGNEFQSLITVAEKL